VSADTKRNVELGFIAGVHGVKGWIKIHSFTDPRAKIVQYRQWILQQDTKVRSAALIDGRAQGKAVVAKLDGIDDRDQAEALVGAQIFVSRQALPECSPGEYYWADLEGLTVRDSTGQVLGKVHHLIGTGAHDVLVLDGPSQRMIPFVLGEVVADVDLENQSISVHWDASYWEQ
jgi:16S rRNA processing protein RimM